MAADKVSTSVNGEYLLPGRVHICSLLMPQSFKCRDPLKACLQWPNFFHRLAPSFLCAMIVCLQGIAATCMQLGVHTKPMQGCP